METNIKDIEFGPEHVGLNVTCLLYGKGKIISFCENIDHYPLLVSFSTMKIYYNKCGVFCDDFLKRTLFIGHNVKITVEEEELPKLICPVCGIEHKIGFKGQVGGNKHSYYYNSSDNSDCPFFYCLFLDEESAKSSMKSLIKAMSKTEKAT